VTLPILRGLDGERRMGKSLGNYVGVAEAPYDMHAKTMSIPDNLMREWFELLTDHPKAEIDRMLDVAQTHPMQAKEMLGKAIVSFYHGADVAEGAAAEWRKRFSERQDPTEIEERQIARSELAAGGQIWICKLLVLLKLAASNNEARRAVTSGSVSIGPDREKISDPTANIVVGDGLIVRMGKKHVVKIKLI
jgi:tyrosyl-tRNA synthetase